MRPALYSNSDIAPIHQFTYNELIHMRGSLNIRMNAPYGLYPNQDKNSASTNGFWFYDSATQDRIINEYKNKRNYTHGPVGPFIDPGYHGLWPGVDFRNASDRNAVENALIKLNKNRIITPVFITPDGWTVDQLRTLEPIFKTPLWQDLCQFVVNGFEQMGDKYGWSNATYCAYASWLKSTFPKSRVIALHGCAKLEAPVGQGDNTDTLPVSWAWKNVADAGFNCFMYQDNMWDNGWIHVDPTNPDGKTDLEHWYELSDISNPSSFIRRFGKGGTWECNIVPIPAAEFWSYGLVWNNLDENQGRSYGRHTIDLGAIGSFDGC